MSCTARSLSCFCTLFCFFGCSYYRAFGDEYDSNGHGTHVTGTLLGFPYSATSISQVRVPAAAGVPQPFLLAAGRADSAALSAWPGAEGSRRRRLLAHALAVQVPTERCRCCPDVCLQAGDADLKFIGMAPAAKLAFIDLGDGTSDSIYTPGDLERGYFDYTNAVVSAGGAV